MTDFLIVAAAIGLVLVVRWAVFRARRGPAHALVAGGAALLDVRTRGEFAGGHLAGAANIPLDELPSRVRELDVKRPVVVYCASGMRSAAAARVLRDAGFREVLNLGPMSAW